MSEDFIPNSFTLPAGINNFMVSAQRDALASALNQVPIGTNDREKFVSIELLESVKKVLDLLQTSNSKRISLERKILIGLLKDLIILIKRACNEDITVHSHYEITRYELSSTLSHEDIARSSRREEHGIIFSFFESQLLDNLTAIIEPHAVLQTSDDYFGHCQRYSLSFFMGKKINP